MHPGSRLGGDDIPTEVLAEQLAKALQDEYGFRVEKDNVYGEDRIVLRRGSASFSIDWGAGLDGEGVVAIMLLDHGLPVFSHSTVDMHADELLTATRSDMNLWQATLPADSH